MNFCRMVPRTRPDFRGVATAWLRGERCLEVLQALAKKLGDTYLFVFPYARIALETLFAALGWRGRRVLMPAFTCATVPQAVVRSGNVPVFVDCAPDSFLVDPQELMEAITSDTDAIILTHLYGKPFPVERLRQLLDASKARHPLLISDASHAPGVTWAGRPMAEQVDCTIYSFAYYKLLASSGHMGCLSTSREDLREVLENYLYALRDTVNVSLWRDAFQLGVFKILFHPPFYGMLLAIGVGTSCSMKQLPKWPEGAPFSSSVTLSCAVTQLKKLPEMIERRRLMASRYTHSLGAVSRVRLFPWDNESVYSHFPCLVEDREAFLTFCRSRGVDAGCHFSVCPPDLPELAAYRTKPFPRARALAARVVNLPLFTTMTEKQQERVIQVVRAYGDKLKNRSDQTITTSSIW